MGAIRTGTWMNMIVVELPVLGMSVDNNLSLRRPDFSSQLKVSFGHSGWAPPFSSQIGAR
jgi:hypothetical protein